MPNENIVTHCMCLHVGLATELLLDRYQLPQASDPTSLLAQHESSLFETCRSLLKKMPSHRSAAFNQQIIPQCQILVEAIGHRMAYDAARDAGVDPAILALFEINAVRWDVGWYIENGLLTCQGVREAEDKALSGIYPLLEGWLKFSEVGKYVDAPIVSDQAWQSFTDTLIELRGSGQSSNPSAVTPGLAKL